ncbi:conjugal transfer protein TraG N-terminal domain-containing protein [Vibrio sp. SCSIO 43140]|uniref:conjugal transfer protein TraG N-terminal domain-containing protein n=1 Tax=Vibrio sp. SCSIO 43140 TaxID=2819100 RepID=UPI002075F9F5|nr:conjugal transfer protein TraG N-terminal domain-containing protein [Vibrio sp. SCSIO 43140]USD58916.1 conjugal transfer protein TraG N-terminal domain-containing protein [Vibrio sp. SCSIO 43140]
MDPFVIYTIGNFEWIVQVFTGLSMAFDTGSGEFGITNYVFGLGLLLSFFAAMLKNIIEKGQIGGSALAPVVQGWLIWMLLFYPRVDVALEHAGTGDTEYFTDIPVGLAIGGTVSTTLPIAFTDILQDIFIMPNSSGHLDALRTLVALEGNVDNTPIRNWGTTDTDFIRTMDNYYNDCVFKDVTIGGVLQEAKVSKMMSSYDTWQAMKVTSTVWYTEAFLGASGTGLFSCKDAYDLISTYINNDNSALAQGFYASLEQQGISDLDVASAAQQLGQPAADAYGLQIKSFLDYHLKKNAYNLPASETPRGMLVDAMEFDAKQKRLYTMAGDRNLWLEMAPATISFFEAFVWFCAPLMSFLVLFGQSGLKLAMSYMRFLLLVGLYPVVMILINLYLDWSIDNSLQASLDNQTAWTIGGLSNFYTESRSYIAQASYLTTMVPLFAYMLLKGGEYGFVSVASKMGGSASVNAGSIAPQISPEMKNGNLKIGNTAWTMTDNGMVQSQSAVQDMNMPTISGVAGLQGSLSNMRSSAESRVQNTQQSVNRSWGDFSQTMRNINRSAGHGTNDNAQYSENMQFASQLDTALQKTSNLSQGQREALIAKLMMDGKIGAGFGAGGEMSGSDQTSSGTQNTTTNSSSTGTSSDTRHTTSPAQQGRRRGSVVQSNGQVVDARSSKEQTDVRNQNSNSSKSNGGSGGKLNFKFGADGNIVASGAVDAGLSKEEKESLNKALGFMEKDSNGLGASYTRAESINRLNQLSDVNGWGERGQNALTDLKSFNSAVQYQHTVQQGFNATTGINTQASTNLTNAARNNEFAQWVMNGYNTKDELAAMSPEQRQEIQAQNAHRAQEIRQGAAHFNGDVGRSAAEYFVRDMKSQYDNVAKSENIDTMSTSLGELSETFKEAGQILNDTNIKSMGQNFDAMASKLDVVKDKTSNEEVMETARDANLAGQGDKDTSSAITTNSSNLKVKQAKDETAVVNEVETTDIYAAHQGNKQRVEENKQHHSLKTEDWSAIEKHIDKNVDVMSMPPEISAVGDKARAVMAETVAPIAAKFASVTESDLQKSGTTDTTKYMESDLKRGSQFLTDRMNLGDNDLDRNFGWNDVKENRDLYSAAMIAMTVKPEDLDGSSLTTNEEIQRHNRAVENIQELRGYMQENPDFEREVRGLVNGAYSLDALQDYKQFKGTFNNGSLHNVDMANVANVGGTLGDMFTDPKEASKLFASTEVAQEYREAVSAVTPQGYRYTNFLPDAQKMERGEENRLSTLQKTRETKENTPKPEAIAQLATTGKEEDQKQMEVGRTNGTKTLETPYQPATTGVSTSEIANPNAQPDGQPTQSAPVSTESNQVNSPQQVNVASNSGAPGSSQPINTFQVSDRNASVVASLQPETANEPGANEKTTGETSNSSNDVTASNSGSEVKVAPTSNVSQPVSPASSSSTETSSEPTSNESPSSEIASQTNNPAAVNGDSEVKVDNKATVSDVSNGSATNVVNTGKPLESKPAPKVAGVADPSSKQGNADSSDVSDSPSQNPKSTSEERELVTDNVAPINEGNVKEQEPRGPGYKVTIEFPNSNIEPQSTFYPVSEQQIRGASSTDGGSTGRVEDGAIATQGSTTSVNETQELEVSSLSEVTNASAPEASAAVSNQGALSVTNVSESSADNSPHANSQLDGRSQSEVGYETDHENSETNGFETQTAQTSGQVQSNRDESLVVNPTEGHTLASVTPSQGAQVDVTRGESNIEQSHVNNTDTQEHQFESRDGQGEQSYASAQSQASEPQSEPVVEQGESTQLYASNQATETQQFESRDGQGEQSYASAQPQTSEPQSQPVVEQGESTQLYASNQATETQQFESRDGQGEQSYASAQPQTSEPQSEPVTEQGDSSQLYASNQATESQQFESRDGQGEQSYASAQPQTSEPQSEPVTEQGDSSQLYASNQATESQQFESRDGQGEQSYASAQSQASEPQSEPVAKQGDSSQLYASNQATETQQFESRDGQGEQSYASAQSQPSEPHSEPVAEQGDSSQLYASNQATESHGLESSDTASGQVSNELLGNEQSNEAGSDGTLLAGLSGERNVSLADALVSGTKTNMEMSGDEALLGRHHSNDVGFGGSFTDADSKLHYDSDDKKLS